MTRLRIPVTLGKVCTTTIELANDGAQVDIILIAIGKDGQPTFCTSLEADSMEGYIEALGKQIAQLAASRKY